MSNRGVEVVSAMFAGFGGEGKVSFEIKTEGAEGTVTLEGPDSISILLTASPDRLLEALRATLNRLESPVLKPVLQPMCSPPPVDEGGDDELDDGELEDGEFDDEPTNSEVAKTFRGTYGTMDDVMVNKALSRLTANGDLLRHFRFATVSGKRQKSLVKRILRVLDEAEIDLKDTETYRRLAGASESIVRVQQYIDSRVSRTRDNKVQASYEWARFISGKEFPENVDQLSRIIGAGIFLHRAYRQEKALDRDFRLFGGRRSIVSNLERGLYIGAPSALEMFDGLAEEGYSPQEVRTMRELSAIVRDGDHA